MLEPLKEGFYFDPPEDLLEISEEDLREYSEGFNCFTINRRKFYHEKAN
jgi:hypothetical protein